MSTTKAIISGIQNIHHSLFPLQPPDLVQAVNIATASWMLPGNAARMKDRRSTPGAQSTDMKRPGTSWVRRCSTTCTDNPAQYAYLEATGAGSFSRHEILFETARCWAARNVHSGKRRALLRVVCGLMNTSRVSITTATPTTWPNLTWTNWRRKFLRSCIHSIRGPGEKRNRGN